MMEDFIGDVILERKNEDYYISFKPAEDEIILGSLNIPSTVSCGTAEYPVTEIGKGAFKYYNNITSVTIPNSVTVIGEDAFRYCNHLASVTIPNSITRIGNKAFENCEELKSVSIPNTVSYMGRSAFSGCIALTAIYYDTESPLKGSSTLFSWDTYNNATLYVPVGVRAKARSIEPWKYFAHIEEIDFSGVNDIVTDSGNGVVDFNEAYEVYNTGGVFMGNSVDNLVTGIYILRQGLIVKKIAVK